MSATSSPSAVRHFFVVGAQRCGTSYLYEMLDEHPEIAMAKPRRPEPKWFLDPAKAARGPAAYDATLFGGVEGAALYGEKGTSYLESPEAGARILATFPEARFVAILREPVERAISNYRFSVENGVETLPIERALTPEAEERPFDRERISVSPFGYLRRGRYAEYLEAWTERVPAERVFVAIFEEMVEDPRVFASLCAFLDVAPLDPPGRARVVNAAAAPRPDVPPALLASLRDSYREPNARLERFLGRPLDRWERA